MSDHMREDLEERKSEVGSHLKAAESSQTPDSPPSYPISSGLALGAVGRRRLSPAGLSARAQAVVAPSRMPRRKMGKERLSSDCESLQCPLPGTGPGRCQVLSKYVITENTVRP